jgi:PKD repeat protein
LWLECCFDVVHVSSSGQELGQASGFYYPGGNFSNSTISVDPTSGACWVADTGNGQVVKLVPVGGEALIAAFSATPTTGVVPLEVAFTDQSSGDPTFWSWDFGDGGTSTQQDPSHTYTSPGVYTVSLTASAGPNSDTEVKNAYVTASFVDVPPDSWAWDEIMACVAEGIVQGYEGGTYLPSNEVTRDQMAVYVSRALVTPSGDAGIPDPTPPATFTDVPSSHWAYKHIEYAVSQGVVQGYDATHYVPNVVVDRGQMAVFIARAKGWVKLGDDMTTAPQLFPDVPTGFWAGTAIKACVDHTVVQGYLDGLYRPGDPVTRDQMAVYVARAFGLMP